MDSFKITCVTCHARLTVRDAAAIGQILACPRCGSMVQVTAPNGATGGTGSAATASGVITASGIAAASAPPPAHASATRAVVTSPAPPTHAPSAVGASAAPMTASSTFADVADFGADLGEQLARLPAVSPGAAAPTSRAATLTVRNATRLSSAKFLAIAAACAIGGSAAVIAVLSLVRGDGNQAPISVQAVAPPTPTADADSTAATPVESAEAPADAAIDAAPHDESGTAVAAAADAGAGDAVAHDVDNNPFAPSPEEAAPPEDAAASSTPSPVPTPPGTSPAPAADDTATAADGESAPDDESLENHASQPRLRVDPLEVDPEGLDLATLLRGESAGSLALSDLPPAEAPERVASEAPAEDAAGEPPADAAPVIEVVNPPAAPAVLLARKYSAVKVDRMPLAQFLDFATSLSALPVSASPAELRLAAVSAATRVSVDAKDATIEQLLAAAMKPLRLTPVIEGPQIVLRRILGDRPRELAYPVDDLVDGDAQQLAGWVQDLVSPEAWRAHGGAGELKVDGATLRIRAAERLGYETILFLERYRTVRGIAPRSKYPAELLTAWANAGAGEEHLAAPATFTFSRPTAVREVFRWWQEELGAAVLVDWPALGAARVWPHSRMRASAVGRPWSEALTAALEPLALGWRVVDRGTIEITSRERVENEPVLEMYRLGEAAKVSATDLLADAAADAQAAVANAPANAAYLDEANRVLFVLAPASVQRGLATRLAADGFLAGAKD